MQSYESFEKLRELARKDPALRRKLLEVRGQRNALSSFCAIARQQGCEMYPMELIASTEDYYAAMKRSTNGGGENSPMLSGWDQFFEVFLQELARLDTE